MKYRYFYGEQGVLVGVVKYFTQCWAESQCDSIGYIDTDVDYNISQYKVDLTTLTLVEKNQ